MVRVTIPVEPTCANATVDRAGQRRRPAGRVEAWSDVMDGERSVSGDARRVSFPLIRFRRKWSRIESMNLAEKRAVLRNQIVEKRPSVTAPGMKQPGTEG